MAVHEWSQLPSRSVDGFQDLTRQFARVLTCKQSNRYDTSLVGLGGPTRYKKIFEMGIGGVLRTRCDSITQDSFRARTSQVEIRDTGCKKMAEACPAKIAREKNSS